MWTLARWGFAVVALPVVAAIAVGAAYVIDRAVAEGEVVRNVTFEGRSLAGLDESEVLAIVGAAAAERLEQPIDIVMPDLTITATAAELGFSADPAVVAARAMVAGRSSEMAADFRNWWESWEAGEDLLLEFDFDPTVVAEFVAAHPERVHRLPVEPWFTGAQGRFEVQQPIPGEFLDPGSVVSALEAAIRPSYPPDAVQVEWALRETVVSQEQLDAALAEAAALATRLTVVVNERPAVIGATSVRRWIDSETVDGQIRPIFVPERVEPSIEVLLAGLGSQAEPPTFAVVGGEVAFELGIPAYRCCAPGSTEALLEAARTGGREAAYLTARLVEPDAGLGAAEALGVTGLISEFTTRHACCQSRVTNIHRIADMVRGQLVMPGERFSINEFIGPRTREKGFVAAGTISGGYFIDDVGGGISQFATTMFNAAFFAGVELDAYRAHSVYISRYPYGREATMSFPQPDLAFVNNTPYAILIWTEYTGSSITVQFYSTPYWEVEQTGQRTTRIGACRRATTFRQRTAPDGTVLEDSVFAVYRPGEGIDCNGNRIPRSN